MNEFCPKCGKIRAENESFINGFCESCFLEDNKLVEIPKEIPVPFCKKCLKIRYKGKWVYQDEGIIKQMVKANVKSRFVKPIIEISLRPTEDKTEADVVVKGRFSGTDLALHFSSMISPAVQVCEDCGRQAGKYYEAILQIRFDKRPSEEQAAEINERVGKLLEKMGRKHERAFITKIVKISNGFDYYLGSNNAAKKMAQILEKDAKERVKISFEVHGFDEHGKVRKRTTYLLRL